MGIQVYPLYTCIRCLLVGKIFFPVMVVHAVRLNLVPCLPVYKVLGVGLHLRIPQDGSFSALNVEVQGNSVLVCEE